MAETWLLVCASVTVVAAYAAVRVSASGVPIVTGQAFVEAGPIPIIAGLRPVVTELLPVLSFLGAAWLVHIVLVVRKHRGDSLILPIVTTLMGLSLALITRLGDAGGAGLAFRQWLWLGIGLALCASIIVGGRDLRWLRRYRYTWALAGMALLALTLVGGHSSVPGGPRLWLGLGGWTFQPSELLKFLLVVFMAGYLADKRELLAGAAYRVGRLRLPPLPYLAPMVVMLGLSLALLAIQRDLGAALLLFTIALGMLYMASGRGGYVLLGLAAFVSGSAIVYRHVELVRDRVAIWLDPWAQAHGLGYQLVQGLLAVGAGGVMGTGLGQGMPQVVPAAHTDFIYAALVEELGLAGALAVLCLYALLVMRGFRSALLARDPFERLLAGGLSFALAAQIFIIVGGVLRLIPLTGITLPFLSYGGSSMLISSLSAGLLLKISGSRPEGNRG